MTTFFERNLTKEPVILINTPDSSGEKWYYRNGEYGSSKQTGCKIDFMFHFGYKVTIDGRERYFKDKIYYSLDKDQEVHWRNDFTLIAGTPDNLAKCESIIAQMNAITDRLKEMFKDPETAEQTLQAQTIKLIN